MSFLVSPFVYVSPLPLSFLLFLLHIRIRSFHLIPVFPLFSLSFSLSPPCAVALLSPSLLHPHLSVCSALFASIIHPLRERDQLHQRTNRTNKKKDSRPFCLSSAQLIHSRQPQLQPDPILIAWPLSHTSSTRLHSSTQVTKTTTTTFPGQTPSHTIRTIHNPPLRFSILKTAILTTHLPSLGHQI